MFPGDISALIDQVVNPLFVTFCLEANRRLKNKFADLSKELQTH